MFYAKKYFFSLLELIITLGILSVLATLLLDNFADIKARECEKITVERGNHIRSKLNGAYSEEKISAFLSDMGRFPSLYIPQEGDGNGGRRLAELYDPSIWYYSNSATSLQKYQTMSAGEIKYIVQNTPGSTFPNDASGITLPYPQVNMNTGWNGPYIHIANPVKGNFYDGWGNSWKILTNYNLHIQNNLLEENHTAGDKIQIYASETEINSLRNVSANKRIRIDGIVSYGSNDSSDAGETNTDPSASDHTFLFPHNMDNHGKENLANLHIILKVRDQADGKWRTLPAIAFWEANRLYSKGEITALNHSLYICITAHTSGSSFTESFWQKLSTAENYTASIHGNGSYSGLCIYENICYVRNSANTESSFTSSNWLQVAEMTHLPDSISLFIFTPVMQGSYEERTMHLGYYHFYRNTGNENAHGVKPLYGTAGSADIDCEGDTSTIYSSGSSYNARYLIAEDHSPANWNEFYIRRLIPGKRKIYCILYNSLTKSCYQTQTELLTLKAGSNYITLYPERKL